MKETLREIFSSIAEKISFGATVYLVTLPALAVAIFYGFIFLAYALPISLDNPEDLQVLYRGFALAGGMITLLFFLMGGGKFMSLSSPLPAVKRMNKFFDQSLKKEEVENDRLLGAVSALIRLPRMNMYIAGLSVTVAVVFLLLPCIPGIIDGGRVRPGLAGFGISMYMYLLFVYSISDLVSNPLRKRGYEEIIQRGISIPDVYGYGFRRKVVFLLGFLMGAVLIMLYLITYTHIPFDYLLLFFAMTALVIILLVLVYVFPLVNVLYHVLVTTGALSRGEDASLVVGNNEKEILSFSTVFNRSLNEFIYLRKNLEVKVKERTELLEKRNRELLENEEKFRTLADSAQDAIIMMDNDGNVSYWNRAAEIIFGYSHDEIMGRPLHEILAPRRYEEMFLKKYPDFKRFGKGLALGKTVEFSAVRKTGEEFPIEISLSAFKLDYKWNAVAILRDITERKDYEEEIYKAKQYAEAANRAKSEFLANMSHEIRTPMNGILGFSEIIKQDCREPEIREKAEIIHRSGMGLLELINDILDLSKIEAGRMEVLSENFDLFELLKQSHLLYSIVAEKKGLDFRLAIDETLPRYIVSDRKKLQQIITNLLSNAVKFTDEGCVAISAETISWYGDEVILKITVEDTGIGIPAEELERVFRSFEQSDASTTRNYEGTGLGLAITRSFVEMLKGHIWAESSAGQGARFSFVVQAEEGREEGILPSVYDHGLEPDMSALSFLVISDDPNTRMLMEYMLKSGAHAVETLPEGAVSIEEIAGRQVDCLFIEPGARDSMGQAVSEYFRKEEGPRELKLVVFGPLHISKGPGDDDDIYDGILEKPLSRKGLFSLLLELYPHSGNNNRHAREEAAEPPGAPDESFSLREAVVSLMALSLDRSSDRKKALELTTMMIQESAEEKELLGEIRDSVNNFEYDRAEELIQRLGRTVEKEDKPVH